MQCFKGKNKTKRKRVTFMVQKLGGAAMLNVLATTSKGGRVVTLTPAIIRSTLTTVLTFFSEIHWFWFITL